MEFLKKMVDLFDRSDRKKALGLFGMMLVGAGFEAVGVGMILPFLSSLSNPATVAENEWAARAMEMLSIGVDDLLLYSGLALLIIYVAKNLYLVLLYHTQYKFLFNSQVKLSRRLLDAYLRSPYLFHVERNSANLLRNVNSEVVTVFNSLLMQVFALAIELLVVAVLVGLLVTVEPVAAPIAVVTFGALAASFYAIVRKKVTEFGIRRQQAAGEMIKWVNQGLGGIKETKIRGNEDFFVSLYERNSQDYADANRYYRLIQVLPRFFVETIGIGGMLAIVIYLMATKGNLEEALPVLGLFAMVGVRLMPSMTRIIAAVTSIRHYRPALEVVHADLKLIDETPRDAATTEDRPFDEPLVLDEVSFRYPNAAANALDGLSLKIRPGSSVGLVGSSGSGKTTTVDLILGLIEPESGAIRVGKHSIDDFLDGWQRKFGYISQPTYLMDDTLRQNIAFGERPSEIDDGRVWASLKAARLADHVETLPEGLETEIGEHGVRFSGGQRQRIGIARALYRDPEIIILDEATSALDNETESQIAAAIESLRGDKTIITIAHRLSTVKSCDTLFFLKDGRVAAQGTFEELNRTSDEFRQMVLADRSNGGSPDEA